jgi:hypothetical protein
VSLSKGSQRVLHPQRRKHAPLTPWTKEETMVATDELTREQIKAIIIAFKGRRPDITDILVDILNGMEGGDTRESDS